VDRNTVLAFALSMIVFVSYVMYQEQRRMEQALELEAQAQQETQAQEKAAAGAAAAADERAEIDGMPARSSAADGNDLAPAPTEGLTRRAPLPPEPARQIAPQVSVLENPQVVATISNEAGLIASWRLREFMERLPEGDVPIELVNPGAPVFSVDVAGLSGTSFAGRRFEVVGESSREVVQRAAIPGGVLYRTIRLDPQGYGFDLDLRFESLRADPVDAAFEVGIPARVSQRADFRELSLLAYREDEGVARELVNGIGQAGFFDFGTPPPPVVGIEGRSRWAGFDAQFFAGLVIDPVERGRLDVDFEALEVGEEARARARLPASSVGSGGAVDVTLRGFLGPKTGAALAAANAGLEHSVDRGWSWLEPLTLFFELALDWLYAIIPNYGWCIIVLTILVRLVTAPLMMRQMRSAERMREVQPKIKALQERYADDRQKQSEEMMKLYREEQINPLGGCLPLLLQMPVLIGLFYALRTSIGLRHAPWILWIDDLSQPATLFTIPGLDFPVRVLPLVMGASMFAQQKMMPQTGMDPVQARMMLIMMPGMMLLISYTFPSGLVLYWTVSNLLGIAHQYWVRNHLQR
jgi:YidC/Oxa1 family membrane protein insertase